MDERYGVAGYAPRVQRLQGGPLLMTRALQLVMPIVLGAACASTVLPPDEPGAPATEQGWEATVEPDLSETHWRKQPPARSERVSQMIERWRSATACPEGVVDMATRRETLCWIPCLADEDCPADEVCIFIIASIAMDLGYRRDVPSGEGVCGHPIVPARLLEEDSSRDRSPGR